MLRVHCMQLFYSLGGPAMGDALYEISYNYESGGINMVGVN